MKPRMQKILKAVQTWLPMTLIVLGSLWLLQAALARTSGHGVIVQGLNYDAGKVKAGTTVNHEVRIINLTSQPVELFAQPSCGCTVVSYPEAAIGGLRASSVNARIDTTGMPPGSYLKAVRLDLETSGGRWQKYVSMRFFIQ